MHLDLLSIILFYFIVVSLSSFFCIFFSLCVVSVVLALVFMPELNSAAYWTVFLRSLLRSVLCGCRLFVSSVYAIACVSVSC